MHAHRDDHLLRCDAELVGGVIDDALVGLVRHEPVDVGSRGPGRTKGILDHVGDHRHGVLEHRAAFHAQEANRFGRGRPAIDIELGFVPAVRTKVRGEHTTVVATAGLLLRLHHHRTGAVAEQHTGGAVFPIEDARERLGPDHQCALIGTGAQQRVGDRDGIDEARTHRLKIESSSAGDAKPCLHRHSRRREGVVGRRSRQHDQINRLRVDMGRCERCLGGMNGEIRRHLAVRRDVALVDAGALHDPFVGGLDARREFRIGENTFRQIAAAAEHNRTEHCHEAAPLTARVASGSPACRRMVALILPSSSSRIISYPTSIAAAKPSGSVPP